MGTLNFYTRKYDKTQQDLLWSRSGDSGDVWRHAKVTVHPTDYNFQV